MLHTSLIYSTPKTGLTMERQFVSRQNRFGAPCCKALLRSLLPSGSTKRHTLAAILSRGEAKLLATKDEALSIYITQQNSLENFELDSNHTKRGYVI